MLYIVNLCEFLCQIMILGKEGIYHPQNAQYSSTSDIVGMIAETVHHKIFISRIFNPAVKIAALIPGKSRNLANKAFGNLSYDMSISEYDFDYRVADLKTSIERTES